MRLAITADLHWGTHEKGDAATELMLSFLRQQMPDALILAGDVGAGEHFEECLAHFDDFTCRKALIPGNHDIWVTDADPRGDSLQVYREHLPKMCSAHGFHYLDQAPIVIPESELAIVGSINWYDYSWSIDQLRNRVHDWEERLRTKVFSRGRHNDARFVRWPLDDRQFTSEVVATFTRHLEDALARVRQAIVVTHHPPFYGLTFPRLLPPITVDGLLWDAFSGNRELETVLNRFSDRIPFVFCGHTHRARESTLGKIHGYNIGGDYHFKRLLWLEWPNGLVQAHEFGNSKL